MTDIGQRNITFVREYLRTEGLQVIAEDVGDIHPRKVYYLPSLGKVRMQKLRALYTADAIVRQRRSTAHFKTTTPSAVCVAVGASTGGTEALKEVLITCRLERQGW